MGAGAACVLWLGELARAASATEPGVPAEMMEGGVVVLTEKNVVDLALRRSLSLQLGELDRRSQRFALRVANREFVPQVTMSVAATENQQRDRHNTPTTGADSTTVTIKPNISQRLPTGGVMVVAWDNGYSQLTPVPDLPGVPGAVRRAWSPAWTVSFAQPLLKGGGLTAGTAGLRQARTQEEMNILGYRSLIIDTVTQALSAFRNYIQVQRQVEIAERSLQRSKEMLEINQLMIDSGRMAAIELVQARADAATRELSAVTARNSLDSARLGLVRLFNLDRSTQFKVGEEPVVREVTLDPAALRDLALRQRPDYLQAKMQVSLGELGLSLARNNRLWPLNLVAGYTGAAEGYPYRSAYDDLRDRKRTAWSVGLQLDVPIWGELNRAQTLLNADINLRKLRLGLEDKQEAIIVEVIEAVRNTEVAFQQVRLARMARELTEEKLKIEREKLTSGHSSTFQLVRFEDDLVNVQINELGAIINYLNALTQLDRVTSSTLETWRIEFKP